MVAEKCNNLWWSHNLLWLTVKYENNNRFTPNQNAHPVNSMHRSLTAFWETVFISLFNNSYRRNFSETERSCGSWRHELNLLDSLLHDGAPGHDWIEVARTGVRSISGCRSLGVKKNTIERLCLAWNCEVHHDGEMLNGPNDPINLLRRLALLNFGEPLGFASLILKWIAG
jgi:hypothetical protein